MVSSYLKNLSIEQRQDLTEKLFQSQDGKCFICEDSIDLDLHQHDIDHIVATSTHGRDNERNVALTHSNCNRSKQASDLQVARTMARFARITPSVHNGYEAPNLGDVLDARLGDRTKYRISFQEEHSTLKFALSLASNPTILSVPIYQDDLSGFRTSFLRVPIEYIQHDSEINPRPIGKNLRKLIEEFHAGFPQLHVALGWVNLKESTKINIFDGQHKVAAQVLLNVREIPVRVFINPDKDRLLTANTRAGTTLRQVAFDKSIQRRLGGLQLADRIRRFNLDKNHVEDYGEFSEHDLVRHFAGERREVKGYVIDRVRSSVTGHRDNKLRGFIEYGGRTTGKPFSYSAVDKTFYSLFISQNMLTSPFNYRLDEGLNPRENEITQLVKLMNMIADKIYINKFDEKLGTYQIEDKLRKGDAIPEDHLRAFRLAREEILLAWLQCIKGVIRQHYTVTGKPLFDENVIFQDVLPEECWQNVSNFIDSLADLPIWKNQSMSSTVFGGKHSRQYWQIIFKTGKTIDGQRVLTSGLNLVEMIEAKEKGR